MKEIIKKYKELITFNKLKDEKYKWEILRDFKGKPNLDSEDFVKEILAMNYQNLIYFNARTVLHSVVKVRPEETKKTFAILFDEERDLTERIAEFQSAFKILYEESGHTLGHHQDERTISSYLTVKYPKKYTFYKYSFYRKFCEYLEEKQAEKGKQYAHYLELNKQLAEVVSKDKELMKLKSKFLGDLEKEDDSNILLAQDVLYQVFERNEAKEIDKVQTLFSQEEFDFYIQFIRNIVDEFNLPYEDERVTYNVRDKRLIFTVGQRYAATLSKERKKTYLLAISTEKETEKSEEFEGTSPNPFLNFFPFEEREKINLDNHYSAIEKELNRTKRSSFKKDENTDLKNIIYNMEESLEETKTNLKMEKSLKHQPLNKILYGPPGTGKTYATKKKAVEIIENIKFSDSKEDRKIILQKYEEYSESNLIQFTTFHQSMSYEDFVEGIKPKMSEENEGEISYEIQPGIFKEICKVAEEKEMTNFSDAYEQLIKDISESEDEYLVLKTPTGKEYRLNVNSNDNLSLYTTKEIKHQGTLTKKKLELQYNGELAFRGWEGYAIGVLGLLKEKYSLSKEAIKSKQNHVIIIDEINRGNVSSIFGELITLIENDKRQGQKEMIEVTLPYSKEKFSVPNNLYIIGTMNTADRSVEALDTALRRRFSFEELLPKPSLLKEVDFNEVDLVQLLTIINQRIEILIDKDHQIGHSYFFGINSLEDLKMVFQDKIIPLLEEYFYGDYGKIGLVLGEEFIEEQEIKNKNVLAKFKAYSDIDFVAEKKIFRLKSISEMEAKEFISIYNLDQN